MCCCTWRIPEIPIVKVTKKHLLPSSPTSEGIFDIRYLWPPSASGFTSKAFFTTEYLASTLSWNLLKFPWLHNWVTVAKVLSAFPLYTRRVIQSSRHPTIPILLRSHCFQCWDPFSVKHFPGQRQSGGAGLCICIPWNFVAHSGTLPPPGVSTHKWWNLLQVFHGKLPNILHKWKFLRGAPVTGSWVELATPGSRPGDRNDAGVTYARFKCMSQLVALRVLPAWCSGSPGQQIHFWKRQKSSFSALGINIYNPCKSL